MFNLQQLDQVAKKEGAIQQKEHLLNLAQSKVRNQQRLVRIVYLVDRHLMQ
jgi:hypothetical protein